MPAGYTPSLYVVRSQVKSKATGVDSLEPDRAAVVIVRKLLSSLPFVVSARERRAEPLGPVFLSYRTSDGRDLTLRLARALRASGVPVWHDHQDLPPGDTERSIADALASGLSGAVVVVTPEIAHSRAVRNQELPAFLKLERDPRFILALANTILGCHSAIDLDAPDRLLRPARPLRSIKQYPLVSDSDIAELARAIVMRRMYLHRASGNASLVLDVQSRREGTAWSTRAPLVVRTPVPEEGSRIPPPEIWEDLKSFLSLLTQLLEEAGATELVVRGGAHLSIALAIGTAVPRPAYRLAVEDKVRGLHWSDSMDGAPVHLDVVPEDRSRPGLAIAVLVDTVPTQPPHDTFGQQVERGKEVFSGSLRITKRQSEIPPEAGAATAARIAAIIREFASQRQTNEVHLFPRMPWALAVLLGRELNTFRLRLYEWDDLGGGQYRYAPTVVVAPGVGGGPIIEIAGTME